MQVITISKVISATEYDDAVVHTPSDCTHFALGDKSSGNQLLEDFAADDVQADGFASFFGTLRGAAYAQRLLDAISTVARSIACKGTPGHGAK